MAKATLTPRRHAFRRLFFWDIASGRVDRVDFLRGLAVLGAMIFLAAAAFAILFTFAERLGTAGAVAGLVLLGQLVGFAAAGALAVVVSTLGFAFLNLIAKRMRDLGLPGWRALGVAWVLGTAFSLGAPLVATVIYIAVVWGVMLLVPTPPRR